MVEVWGYHVNEWPVENSMRMMLEILWTRAEILLFARTEYGLAKSNPTL